MKTLNTLFTALLLTFALNTGNAQLSTSTLLEQSELTGWEITENWVQAYQDKVSQHGSLNWIGEVVTDGADVLLHPEKEGIILVLETENEDALSPVEMAETEYTEGNGNRLFPTDVTQNLGNGGAVAELRGQLGGQEVIIQKVCLEASLEGNMVVVLSIVSADAVSFQMDNFDSGLELATAYNGPFVEQISMK